MFFIYISHMYGLKGLVQMVTLVTSLLWLRIFCHQPVTSHQPQGIGVATPWGNLRRACVENRHFLEPSVRLTRRSRRRTFARRAPQSRHAAERTGPPALPL